MSSLSATILPSPVMRESTALAAYWRGGGRAPVWYLSDPARGDLELVDPLSRRVAANYRWMFPREAFISGVRPDILAGAAVPSRTALLIRVLAQIAFILIANKNDSQ